jgi:hypothetical protein
MKILALMAMCGLIAASSPAWAQSSTSGSGAAPPPSSPSTPNLSISAGGSTWTGDYGGRSTSDISAALLTARYTVSDVRLTAALPWMSIRTADTIYSGIGGTPLVISPAAAQATRTREGLGDLTLGAAYSLPTEQALGFDLEAIGRVKVPTGSSAISTGKTDYSLGGEVSKSIGPISPFGSVSYRVFGDGRGWTLKDGFATSVGASYALPAGIVGVFSYDYAQAASRYIDDAHELVLGVSGPLTPKLRLTGFGSVGLSSGASALSGGLSLTAAL